MNPNQITCSNIFQGIGLFGSILLELLIIFLMFQDYPLGIRIGTNIIELSYQLMFFIFTLVFIQGFVQIINITEKKSKTLLKLANVWMYFGIFLNSIFVLIILDGQGELIYSIKLIMALASSIAVSLLAIKVNQHKLNQLRTQQSEEAHQMSQQNFPNQQYIQFQ